MLVITDDGDNLGVLDKQTALNKARELDSDLVLINPNAEPPVAKIIAWSKFKYEQSKKKRATSKSKGGEVKEIWIKPLTEDFHIQFKLKRVSEFLSKGNKVKITVIGKGRIQRSQMESALEKVLEMLNSVAEKDGEPKNEGRNLTVFVKQKKHGKQDQESKSEDPQSNS